MRLLLMALTLTAISCKPGSPTASDPSVPGKQTPQVDRGQQQAAGPQLPQAKVEKLRYQGKTASQWAVAYFDQDPDVCQSGASALRQLGEEGFPYLLKGLLDGTPYQQNRAMWATATQGKLYVPHAKEVLPILRKHLREDGPNERMQAGGILMDMGKAAAEALPEIKALLTVKELQADPQRFKIIQREIADFEKLVSDPS